MAPEVAERRRINNSQPDPWPDPLWRLTGFASLDLQLSTRISLKRHLCAECSETGSFRDRAECGERSVRPFSQEKSGGHGANTVMIVRKEDRKAIDCLAAVGEQRASRSDIRLRSAISSNDVATCDTLVLLNDHRDEGSQGIGSCRAHILPTSRWATCSSGQAEVFESPDQV